MCWAYLQFGGSGTDAIWDALSEKEGLTLTWCLFEMSTELVEGKLLSHPLQHCTSLYWQDCKRKRSNFNRFQLTDEVTRLRSLAPPPVREHACMKLLERRLKKRNRPDQSS